MRLLVSSVLIATVLGSTGYAQTPTTPPAPGAPPLSLTLEDAVARGVRENVNARLRQADVVSAQGEHWVDLKDLLPTASARFGQSRQVINLAAFGLSVPGIPNIVGPFNVHDARVYVSQPVIDLHGLYGSRSSSAGVHAAELTLQDTRSVVSLAVRNLYLQALSSASRLAAARAQTDTARALLNQATDLKNAGVVPGIDVLRAQVQVRSQEQRAIVAENDFEKGKLQLARAIGLPLGQSFVLADEMPYAPLQTMDLDAALAQAMKMRDDYRAAEARLQAALESKRAALADNYPSLHVSADYGNLGQSRADAHSTYTMLAQVHVPLFNAEITRGHVLEADGDLQRRTAELDDFRAQVEYEVRAAYLDVRAAEEQLQAARDEVALANQELEQTRDRFAAGVTGNIEVVQAQESVARATENYISSLYAHNLAKASLAHAIGGAF